MVLLFMKSYALRLPSTEHFEQAGLARALLTLTGQ
jgi:hypothetical protein